MAISSPIGFATSRARLGSSLIFGPINPQSALRLLGALKIYACVTLSISVREDGLSIERTVRDWLTANDFLESEV